MSLLQILLALACFGIGFLIADSSIISSPWATAAVIAAVLGISVLLRHVGNKKK